MHEDVTPGRRTVLRAAGVAVGTTLLGSTAYASVAENSNRIAARSRTPEHGVRSESVPAAAEEPWTGTYDEGETDRAVSILPTDDDGLVAAGDTNVSGEGNDAWLFKVDAGGDLEWSRVYDGQEDDDPWPNDIADAVTRTADGGFAVGGSIALENSDREALLVKTDAEGRETWRRTYGFDRSVHGEELHQLDDGGYLMLTTTLLIRTDAEGEKQWHVDLGTDEFDIVIGRSVVRAHGGGYLVAGFALREYGVDSNILLTEVTEDGERTGIRSMDVGGGDRATDIERTDDGYVVAGLACDRTAGGEGALLLHLDRDAERDWYRVYTDEDQRKANAVVVTDDGGYFVGADATEESGGSTFWMGKTDASGTLEWTDTRRVGDYSYLFDVAQTTDGAYVAGGFSGRRQSGTDPTDALLVNLGRPE